MERRIDFWRDRWMLCGICGHEWLASLDWIDRWEQSGERCPGCGATCELEGSPRVTVDPGDVALDDDQIVHLSWYHTSTQPDWPSADYDPTASPTAVTRRRTGGDERVAAWAARHRAKALHVGTYEAAVHNMFRRIYDQADQGRQFYLYRLHLKPSVSVRKGWLIDPGNFVGDVALNEVCPADIDVARYLNYHEDPGGLSLALGRDAIGSVQKVAIPLADAWDGDWVHGAVRDLEAETDVAVRATGTFGKYRRSVSPRTVRARELGEVIATMVPVNLRAQFGAVAGLNPGEAPLLWARRVDGLRGLIETPDRTLAALDRVEEIDL